MTRVLVLILLLGVSTVYGEIYTWKDGRGTVFYTNSLDEIPARHLKKARVLNVATGKMGGPATAQPSPVPGATPPPQEPAAENAAPPIPAAPLAASPAPSGRPPTTVLTAPQLQPREMRGPRKTSRRRERNRSE